MDASASPPARNPFTLNAYSANYHNVNRASKDLPVSRHIPQLLETLAKNRVMILVGETGSGKTTQFPKELLLHDADIKKLGGPLLALTQPRQLAAAMV